MEPNSDIVKSEIVCQRFENFITNLVNDVHNGNFPKTGLSSTSIDFGAARSRRKFAMVVYLMSKCYSKIKARQDSTVRDLFYENLDVFKNQTSLNSTIMSLRAEFKVTRADLCLESSAKGLIAGDVTWKSKGLDPVLTKVAHFPKGMLIPSNLAGIRILPSSAQFVLVVEKDAVFQRLIEENVFYHLGPFILVTGKGYPDLATRFLLHQLSEQLRIPTFALVDSDPYGIEIASIYKRGSLNINKLIDNHEFIVPDLKLLGLLPSEVDRLSLPSGSKIPLSEKDRRKLHLMARRMNNDKSWLQEITALSQSGVKVELEALSQISAEYLSTVYLKHKLSPPDDSGSSGLADHNL